MLKEVSVIVRKLEILSIVGELDFWKLPSFPWSHGFWASADLDFDVVFFELCYLLIFGPDEAFVADFMRISDRVCLGGTKWKRWRSLKWDILREKWVLATDRHEVAWFKLAIRLKLMIENVQIWIDESNVLTICLVVHFNSIAEFRIDRHRLRAIKRFSLNNHLFAKRDYTMTLWCDVTFITNAWTEAIWVPCRCRQLEWKT